MSYMVVEAITLTQKSGGNGQAIDEEIFLTMWNGCRDFAYWIDREAKKIHIQRKYIPSSFQTALDYEHVFLGEDRRQGEDSRSTMWHGSSVLVHIKGSLYLFLCRKMVFFNCDEDDIIMDFASPMGNSLVPMPYAVGQKNFYLPDEQMQFPRRFCIGYEKMENTPTRTLYNHQEFMEERERLKNLEETIKNNPSVYDYERVKEFFSVKYLISENKDIHPQKMNIVIEEDNFHHDLSTDLVDITIATIKGSILPDWAVALDNGDLEEFIKIREGSSYLKRDETFGFSPLGYAHSTKNSEAISRLSMIPFGDCEDNILEILVTPTTPFWIILVEMQDVESFEHFCRHLGDRVMSTINYFAVNNLLEVLVEYLNPYGNMRTPSTEIICKKLLVMYKIPFVSEAMSCKNDSDNFYLLRKLIHWVPYEFQKNDSYYDLISHCPIKFPKFSMEDMERIYVMISDPMVLHTFMQRAIKDNAIDINFTQNDEDILVRFNNFTDSIYMVLMLLCR